MSTLTVAQCQEKWKALLEGLDGSLHSVVAWLLEQEVRHQIAETADGAATTRAGSRAKVYLPALRLAARRLLPTSAVEQLGRVATWPQSLTVEDVSAALREALVQIQVAGGLVLEWEPGEIGVQSQIQALAERTYEALLAYPVEGR